MGGWEGEVLEASILCYIAWGVLYGQNLKKPIKSCMNRAKIMEEKGLK